MLHLIWTKDTSDEGKGIKMRLLSCFQSLYLEPDYKKSRKENVSTITKNLIELTYHATLGELTSLEQVLSTLMSENNIAADVIERLWTIYGKTNNTTPKQVRKGAIIILGMLAKSKTRIVSDKLEVMLKIGLGPWGKQDLDLAKYTCIALQRLNGTNSNVKGRGIQEGIRYPLRHPMFARLKSIIEYETSSRQW
jgi:condensin complex subunit 1